MQRVRKTTIIKVMLLIMAIVLTVMAGVMGLTAKEARADEPVIDEPAELEFTIEVTSYWTEGTQEGVTVKATHYQSENKPNLYRALVPYEAESVKVSVTLGEDCAEYYAYKQQFSKVNAATGNWNFRPYQSSPWWETISFYRAEDVTEIDDPNDSSKKIEVLVDGAEPIATYTLEIWRGSNDEAKTSVEGDGEYNVIVEFSQYKAKPGDMVTVTIYIEVVNGDVLTCNDFTFAFFYDKDVMVPKTNLGGWTTPSETNRIRSDHTNHEYFWQVEDVIDNPGCVFLWLGTGGEAYTIDEDADTGLAYIGEVDFLIVEDAPAGDHPLYWSEEDADAWEDANGDSTTPGAVLPSITIYEPSHVSTASISVKQSGIVEGDDETGYGAAITFDVDNAYRFETAITNSVKEISLKIESPIVSGGTEKEEQTVTVSYGDVEGQNVVLNENGNFEVEIPLNFNASENVITVTVTAQDGKSENSTVYTITVPLGSGETTAEIETVTLKKTGASDKGFTYNASTQTYTINAPVEYSDIANWKLNVVAEGNYANISIANKEGTAAVTGSGEHTMEASLTLNSSGAATTANEYVLTVTPQAGEAVEYNVVVNVAIEKNAEATITVSDKNGEIAGEWGGNVYEINEDVDITDAQITVNVVATGAHASIKINGAAYTNSNKTITYNTEGYKTITIVVESEAYAAGLDTSEAGRNEYEIKVNIADNSGDVTLKGTPAITLGGNAVEVKVTSKGYTVRLPKESEFSIVAEANSAAATLEIESQSSNGLKIDTYDSGDTVTLTGNMSKLVITVTYPATGKVATYEIEIETYEESDRVPDATLSAIGVEIDGESAELTAIKKNTYTVSVAAGASTIKVTAEATAAASGATVKISALNENNAELSVLSSGTAEALSDAVESISIEVRDLSETEKYTIVLIRATQEVSVELAATPTVSKGSISGIGATTYEVKIDSTEGSFGIVATAKDAANAQVSYKKVSANGNVTDADNTQIDIADVTAVQILVVNGSRREVYTVYVRVNTIVPTISGEIGIKSGDSDVVVAKVSDDIYTAQLTKGMTSFKVEATATEGDVKVYAIAANGEVVGEAHDAGEEIDITGVKYLRVVATNGDNSSTYTVLMIDAAAADLSIKSVGVQGAKVKKVSEDAYYVQLTAEMEKLKLSVETTDSNATVTYKVVDAAGAASASGAEIALGEKEIKAVQITVANGEESQVYTLVVMPAEVTIDNGGDSESAEDGDKDSASEPAKKKGNGGLIACIIIFALLFVGVTVFFVLELLGIFSFKNLSKKKEKQQSEPSTEE